MTSQSPMNISKNNWDNYCDEKCAYSIDYKTSANCTAKNYGSYLQLSYDSSMPPPVTFNGYTYNVESVEIYSPSLHYFNGVQADGEVIITHQPTGMGAPLMVCIPLNSLKAQTSSATQLIANIVNGSMQLKPNSGDATNIKLNDYNLNNVVPQTPFYYYEDKKGNIIVYGLENAIYIDSATKDSLKSIIIPATDLEYPSVEYYSLNKHGPMVGGGTGDGQIYIDCQPTGNTEETMEVEYSKPATVNNLETLFNGQVGIFIAAIFIFIVLIVLIYKLLMYLSGNSTAKMTTSAATSAAASATTSVRGLLKGSG